MEMFMNRIRGENDLDPNHLKSIAAQIDPSKK